MSQRDIEAKAILDLRARLAKAEAERDECRAKLERLVKHVVVEAARDAKRSGLPTKTIVRMLMERGLLKVEH